MTYSFFLCRYGYEAELLQLLEQLVREMDRKIERQKERAIKDNAPREPGQAERAELDALQARERGPSEPSDEPLLGVDSVYQRNSHKDLTLKVSVLEVSMLKAWLGAWHSEGVITRVRVLMRRPAVKGLSVAGRRCWALKYVEFAFDDDILQYCMREYFIPLMLTPRSAAEEQRR